MAKNKVYAIKEGFDFEKNERVQNKIVTSWNECQKYIKGVKGAIYKSFEDRSLAEFFLGEENKLLRKGKDKYDENCLHVYVDGSFYQPINSYSYGLVAVKDNVVEYIEGGHEKSKEGSNIRQIAGELRASIRAVEYALENKHDKLVIFHDYEGICHHATGFWGRKDESSKNYYEKMQSFMKKGIKIEFVQVKSHEADLFNEMADTICKRELGISGNKTLDNYLVGGLIEVLNEETRDRLASLVSSNSENIVLKYQKIDKAKKAKKVEAKKTVDDNRDILIEDINKILEVLDSEKLGEVLRYVKRKKSQKK